MYRTEKYEMHDGTASAVAIISNNEQLERIVKWSVNAYQNPISYRGLEVTCCAPSILCCSHCTEKGLQTRSHHVSWCRDKMRELFQARENQPKTTDIVAVPTEAMAEDGAAAPESAVVTGDSGDEKFQDVSCRRKTHTSRPTERRYAKPNKTFHQRKSQVSNTAAGDQNKFEGLPAPSVTLTEETGTSADESGASPGCHTGGKKKKPRKRKTHPTPPSREINA